MGQSTVFVVAVDFFLVSLGKKELDHPLAAVREISLGFALPLLFSGSRKTESEKAGGGGGGKRT